MTLAFAVESWVVSILGWTLLTIQEMWAWSLLSAYVFYSLLVVSTCNIVFAGLFPDSKKPKMAYFATILCLALHSFFCILDTVQPLQISKGLFRAPSGSNCTLARVNQVHYFNDSQLYLIQAGNVIGYLLVQLIVSGAPILDPEVRSLWPGSMWGNSLLCMLCMRFVIMFDSTSRGVKEVDDQFFFFMFFSEPIQALEITFMFFLLFFLILMALQGSPFLRPVDFWYVSIINAVGSFVFSIVAFSILYERNLLTVQTLLVLIVPAFPIFYGVFQQSLNVSAGPVRIDTGKPPPDQVPMSTVSRVKPSIIPFPIQMEREKKKGV